MLDCKCFLKNWANPGLFICLFSVFLIKNFTETTARTRQWDSNSDYWIEGVHADHLFTITALQTVRETSAPNKVTMNLPSFTILRPQVRILTTFLCS